MWMQREHQDSEYTTRETTGQVGVRPKTESDCEERRWNNIQIWVHETFICCSRQIDLAETEKNLAQRMSEPRAFDFSPLKRVARYLVGKTKAALRF